NEKQSNSAFLGLTLNVKNWINVTVLLNIKLFQAFCSPRFILYEASTNELVNEELGIAYPIIDGIPNMIPQAARMTHQNKKQEETEQR
ncbi:hypothetical protein E2I00_016221, partial [Balaenoptera physalus]